MRTAVVVTLLVVGMHPRPLPAADAARPNILWLTSEDHGPHMGCYGDTFATTPNVDRLAAKGMIYTACLVVRPGLRAGAHDDHLRPVSASSGASTCAAWCPIPAGKQMFPQLLREAGYYCTNNAKEDYNLAKPGQVWDDSSAEGALEEPQARPAVLRRVQLGEEPREPDPRAAAHSGPRPGEGPRAGLPSRHARGPPGLGAVLRQRQRRRRRRGPTAARSWSEDGLAEDTIVFYFADHGSGMPRSKRWPCDSGLHVPLVVYIPEKWRAPGARRSTGPAASRSGWSASSISRRRC